MEGRCRGRLQMSDADLLSTIELHQLAGYRSLEIGR